MSTYDRATAERIPTNYATQGDMDVGIGMILGHGCFPIVRKLCVLVAKRYGGLPATLKGFVFARVARIYPGRFTARDFGNQDTRAPVYVRRQAHYMRGEKHV